MSRFEQAQERDMILFVGSYLSEQQQSLKQISKDFGKEIIACVLVSATDP